jgi:adenylate cyclase, class 2
MDSGQRPQYTLPSNASRECSIITNQATIMIAEDPIEAECKFRVLDQAVIRANISNLATFVAHETHRDTYLRHPSRDFRVTDEALRIREINGQPFVTYKGPKLEGPIKIRPEIELPLVLGTCDDWLKIWIHLGFQTVLQVHKQRDVFQFLHFERALTITLDEVHGLGCFVEIERVLHSKSEIDLAQQDIQQVASLLGLQEIERRSYLGMLLAETGAKIETLC